MLARRKKTTHPSLWPDTAFEDAQALYIEALEFSGASHHTVKAFRSDLNVLGEWAEEGMPIGRFSTYDLNQFLHWMQHDRGKPCSPKTYARRVTTLKNFFGYLHEIEAIPRDPSAAVIQRPVSSPLPDVLEDDEVLDLIEAAENMRHQEKPDTRPYVLLSLLLQTGIKKSETAALHIMDIERDYPDGPRVWIRYSDPKHRFKERQIHVSDDWIDAVDEYVYQRKPGPELFDCTPRNMEYILGYIAQAAGMEKKRSSFEIIRWTSALSDWMMGVKEDDLRHKLGVSRVTWARTSERLDQLGRMRGYERPPENDADEEDEGEEEDYG